MNESSKLTDRELQLAKKEAELLLAKDTSPNTTQQDQKKTASKKQNRKSRKPTRRTHLSKEQLKQRSNWRKLKTKKRQAEDSITDAEVERAMRPPRYQPDSDRSRLHFVPPIELMVHTLESAKLDLDRRHIKYSEVDCWLIPHLTTYLCPPLSQNVRTRHQTPPKNVVYSWKTLMYKQAGREQVYLIPPPSGPVYDDEWEEIAERSLLYLSDGNNLSSKTALLEKLPLPYVEDELSSDDECDQFQDLKEIDLLHRRTLIDTLAEYGVLPWDSHYAEILGNEDLHYFPNQPLDTTERVRHVMTPIDTLDEAPWKLNEDDPRMLWHKLRELLEESNIGITAEDIKEMFYTTTFRGYMAGVESERVRIESQHASHIDQGESFQNARGVKPLTQELKKAILAVAKLGSTVTKSKVESYISENGRDQEFTELGLSPNSIKNTLQQMRQSGELH